MRALIQRVLSASVNVDGATTGKIGPGLLVLLGVSKTDTVAEAEMLAAKIPHLRIFEDSAGKMNLSLLDTAGALLVVSQFTLYGDCRKGRRPSFEASAPAAQARALYEHFVLILSSTGLRVATGVFQAHMEVSLVNDGPVTLMLDTASLRSPSAPPW